MERKNQTKFILLELLAVCFCASSGVFVRYSALIPCGFAELWPLLGLAVCLQVFGQNLMAYCQGNVSVNLSSIICLTQPAIAAIYSLLLFGEKLTLMEIAGICIVVIGVYLVKHQYGEQSAETT